MFFVVIFIWVEWLLYFVCLFVSFFAISYTYMCNNSVLILIAIYIVYFKVIWPFFQCRPFMHTMNTRAIIIECGVVVCSSSVPWRSLSWCRARSRVTTTVCSPIGPTGACAVSTVDWVSALVLISSSASWTLLILDFFFFFLSFFLSYFLSFFLSFFFLSLCSFSGTLLVPELLFFLSWIIQMPTVFQAPNKLQKLNQNKISLFLSLFVVFNRLSIV